jgi:hypothetical protein
MMFEDEVFNATFNNSSALSWLSVLLVKEIRVHGENHRPAAFKLFSKNQTLFRGRCGNDRMVV